MSAALNWRTVTGSRHPQFLVNGTELSNALCGRNSRFQICEIRCRDEERYPDCWYAVRDAESVSDAEVKAGKRPPIVARFRGLDEALKFINNA